MLFTMDRFVLKQALKLGFCANNNEAEYEALLAGLKVTLELQVKEITIYCDSLLVAK